MEITRGTSTGWGWGANARCLGLPPKPQDMRVEADSKVPSSHRGEARGWEEVWGLELEMEGTAGETGDGFAELGAGAQEHTREGLSAAVMPLVPFPRLL